MSASDEARDWQHDVWDRMSAVYPQDIDTRFGPVVAHVIARANLQAGERVLDVGTGTGTVALEAARRVGPSGQVIATDISGDMLAIAQRRARDDGLTNLRVAEGGAERIDASDGAFDVVLGSLCFMYVIDRVAAAAECARVLRPGGRFVGAVWAGPDECDIVRFQATAGSFAPPPPVPGVGPGALADATPFVEQLAAAGIDARVEIETCLFEFPNLEAAWGPLAGVTAAALSPERVAEAKAAIQQLMWPDPAAPRTFSNQTLFLVGARR